MRTALLSLLAFYPLAARQMPIHVYTSADGLAGTQVQRIVRDSQGYLWFCTTDGLSRFDGHRFVNYGREDGLPSDNVFDLEEERNGRLLAATELGLAEFDPSRTPHFIPRALPKGAESVRQLLVDRSGRLWVGTYGGLYRSDTDGFQPVQIGAPNEYAGSHVTALAEDHFGALWIGARSGLYRRWPDGRVERYTTADGLPHKNVEAVLEDQRGRLWMGTRDGLCLLRHNSSGRAHVAAVYTSRDGLPASAVWALFQDSAQRLWVATQRGFAEILVNPTDSAVSFAPFTQSHGLTIAVSIALAEDAAGNLWIGTEGGAARLAQPGFETFGEADRLSPPQVASIFEARDGTLHALTRDGRIAIHALACGRFRRVTPAAPTLNNLGWTFGQLAFQSRRGEWWIATGDGLLRYGATDHLQSLAAFPPRMIYRKRHGLAGNSVTIAYEDSRGDVWFQSMASADVAWHRWHAVNETLRTYSVAELGISRTSDLRTLAEDQAGNLWMGFASGQLVRYTRGSFHAFGPAAGVPPGGIQALYADNAGFLWAGSSESGLIRIGNPTGPSPGFTNLASCAF